MFFHTTTTIAALATQFGSFLAVRLEADPQARLKREGVSTSWPGIMRDLHQLQAVRISLEGIDYLMRTDLEGRAF